MGKDKEINRFVIICIEQYALSVNQSSEDVFLILRNNDIIQELANGYEDMHGMSTYYVNEYINKRLGIKPLPTSGHKNNVLSNTILISQTVELIAQEYDIALGYARDKFYLSGVIRLLEDEETGLYGESALFLMSLYEARLKKHVT